ncbi:hypothetical protein C4181_19760 [Clostridioides difficile]|nr:hypothetical protein [Clostridioides difficile]
MKDSRDGREGTYLYVCPHIKKHVMTRKKKRGAALAYPLFHRIHCSSVILDVIFLMYFTDKLFKIMQKMK